MSKNLAKQAAKYKRKLNMDSVDEIVEKTRNNKRLANTAIEITSQIGAAKQPRKQTGKVGDKPT